MCFMWYSNSVLRILTIFMAPFTTWSCINSATFVWQYPQPNPPHPSPANFLEYLTSTLLPFCYNTQTGSSTKDMVKLYGREVSSPSTSMTIMLDCGQFGLDWHCNGDTRQVTFGNHWFLSSCLLCQILGVSLPRVPEMQGLQVAQIALTWIQRWSRIWSPG